MKQENPAALYSKELLTEALIGLMKEKDYANISITELTRRADVGRRTFYRHFKAKEDILSYELNKISDEYYCALIKESRLDTRKISEIFFTICLNHLSFLRDLYKQGLMILLFYEIDKILPRLHQKVITPQFAENQQKNMSYILAFQSGGFWSILNRWLEEGGEKTPKEMADVLSAIIPNLI